MGGKSGYVIGFQLRPGPILLENEKKKLRWKKLMRTVKK